MTKYAPYWVISAILVCHDTGNINALQAHSRGEKKMAEAHTYCDKKELAEFHYELSYLAEALANELSEQTYRLFSEEQGYGY